MTHVLIVDDASVDRELAGGLIKRSESYHVEYASNGIDALEHLEVSLPFAVVTDLDMPEMDGMELIRIMSRRFPRIPIVVMAGHGNEEVALQALLQGATDYVPKSRLAVDLVEAIRRAVRLASSDRQHARLSQCLRRLETRHELENDVLLIAPLVDQFRQAAVDLGLVQEADMLQFSKAMAEAMWNGIFHGNLELTAAGSGVTQQLLDERRQQPPYRERRLHIHGVFTTDEARFTIRDAGPGFDPTKFPDVRSNPRRLADEPGRGLNLIRMFMDEVTFNEIGNEITLVRRARRVRDELGRT